MADFSPQARVPGTIQSPVLTTQRSRVSNVSRRTNQSRRSATSHRSQRTEKSIADARQRSEEIDKLVEHYKIDHLDDSDAEEDAGQIKKPIPIVDWPLFDLGIVVVIALTILTFGLEVNARSASGNTSSIPGGWLVLEMVFCLVFVTELGLRIYYHQLEYFTHPHQGTWNIADMLIICLSVIDNCLLMPIGVGGTIRYLVFLRLVRVVKLIRLVRLFVVFKQLWLVCNGLLHSLKTLLWVFLMIFFLCYSFGLVMTLAVGRQDEVYDQYFMRSGGWDHEVYFRTSWRSLFSMVQVLTLDNWNEGIVRHVSMEQPGLLVFFLIFIVVSTFGLLNLLVGIMVERTLLIAEEGRNKKRRAAERGRQEVFNQLRHIFEAGDADGSGTLTLQEVADVMQLSEINTKLRMIDLPVDNPKHLFQLLDYHQTGEITIDEFVTGCMRMNGPAKSKDLLAAQVALGTMQKYCAEFDKEVAIFNDKLGELFTTAEALIDHGERVFLNTREYRMRHPDMTQDTLPLMNTAMLDSAPWETPPPPKEIPVQKNTVALQSPAPSAIMIQDSPYAARELFSLTNSTDKADESDLALAVPGTILT